jgi:hypothetical protein
MHTKHDEHVVEVDEALLAAGAPPTCFVVSDNDLDGQEVPLREAVEELMWSGEGFLSCRPGRLGRTALSPAGRRGSPRRGLRISSRAQARIQGVWSIHSWPVAGKG